MPKLVWVVADGFSEYNSSHFRCTLFYNQLKSGGNWKQSMIFTDDWLMNNQNCKNECLDADIIIIQRVLIKESLATAQFYRKNGKKVYVDFDDAYQLIGEENAAYPFWGQGKVNIKSPIKYQKLDMRVENPVSQFANALAQIDGGITPSRLLSSDWSKYNKMYVLPNYLDIKRYDRHYKERKDRSPLVIGWGGSMSHLTSFTGSGVVDALQQMTKSRLAKFLLVGDNRILPLLGIDESELLFNPYVMWMDWLRVLSRFDIGLAPLAGEYDCRRSRLKVMEYIALGIPFIATKSAVYEDFYDCESGIFVDQGDSSKCIEANSVGWMDAIEQLARNYDVWVKKAVDARVMYRDKISIEMAGLDSFFSKLL